MKRERKKKKKYKKKEKEKKKKRERGERERERERVMVVPRDTTFSEIQTCPSFYDVESRKNRGELYPASFVSFQTSTHEL